MKISLALGPNQPLDVHTAWGCLTTNQLVLPGLGTVMAGRRSGYVQAVLALVGLGVTLGFALALLRRVVQVGHLPEGLEELAAFWRANRRCLFGGGAGFVLFGAAWLWALGSSLSILRRAGPTLTHAAR